MKKHTKIYMDHYGYDVSDFIECELCRAKAIDVHHINGRGKDKDVIENLIAVCRDCHVLCHAVPSVNKNAKFVHLSKL